MKSFTIKSNDSDQRLDKFIKKSVPNLPQSLMYKYIRTKRIKVNSKRAEISTRLHVGDTVDMYINDEFLASRKKQERRKRVKINNNKNEKKICKASVS